MLEIREENLKRILKKCSVVLVAGTLAMPLTGCIKEVSTNSQVKYDVIDTFNSEISTNGIQQELEVPGQDFKLIVNYKCVMEEGAKWTVTSDKKICMDVYTKGLPKDKKVYIDNVHTDTTIRSIYPTIDGITQDSMDDRIHNYLMYGFSISDENFYSSINLIEGQNDTFIKGTTHGFDGYYKGTVIEKRRVESEYLATGVYANQISSIIDLIIVDESGVMTCVSVPSDVQVSVWPFIEKVKRGKKVYTYYFCDKTRKKVEVETFDQDEYEQKVKKLSLD